eukprot:TRINITY_DN83453_c0_g1_i1.p1 TRINITY_DN83453_c0_g1~~TRINITY_DN83453_c0_g1_i1.p1  ORF type:complete len:365 (+),score=44.89 TRINITY_DN83453_c0_g1_i1:82-1176(+)
MLACAALGLLVGAGPTSAESLKKLIARLPDKQDVVGHTTTSRKFKRDLANFCTRGERCRNKTALELGVGFGHSTALLSRLFRRVLVLDNETANLEAAKQLNSDRENVVYMQFDLYNGLQPVPWASALRGNNVSVVFIDASHFYNDVVSDIDAAIGLTGVETLGFDDVGALPTVRRAVSLFERTSTISCKSIGKPWGQLRADVWGTEALENRDVPEGLICVVEHPGFRVFGWMKGRGGYAWPAVVVGLHFACYQIASPFQDIRLPRYEFTFQILQDQFQALELRMRGVEWSEDFVTQVTAAPYTLRLNEEISGLGHTIMFSQDFKRCSFRQDRGPTCQCHRAKDVLGLMQQYMQSLDETLLLTEA